jgi:ParB family transcriptional regulator, chromosome partitioning protein
VAGGADGRLFVIGDAVRALEPGGDGGIRAIACVGDGRAALGLGDGSIRLCFLVGEVEATDRSGDHGHAGAVGGLALGPAIVDDAGREQPRRLFSLGEDGALKAWLIDGGRARWSSAPGRGRAWRSRRGRSRASIARPAGCGR